MKKICFFLALLVLDSNGVEAWGFYGHKLINKSAVYILPPEMFPFFKANIRFITENATAPDSRRYAVKGEAERHFIDIDVYGDSALYKMPRKWEDAVAKYTEDTLKAYGIVPWHVEVMKKRLTSAFIKGDPKLILRIASEIGHYIADCNVPLHTTENYNGQKTNQYGIHAFWETRCVELFSDNYDLFLERARYIENPLLRAWQAVEEAHLALDSVFGFERELTLEMGDDKKYAYEVRNGINLKTYSYEFAKKYHERLNGQIQRRMRTTIQMIADFWFTAWVDAGQPDLNRFLDSKLQEELNQEREEELKEVKSKPSIPTRQHEGVSE
jgi:hypothetical protein